MHGPDIQQEIIAILKEEHPPALTWKEANKHMNSWEVFSMIRDQWPGEFSVEDVYDLMKEAGYVQAVVPGEGRLVWLMK